MRKKKLTSLIVLVFVLLCNCDYFKSLCEPENAPKKQPTTLQNIVNNATDGEIINLEEWENVTDYTATIDKKLTIKSGNLNGASLTVKAENVKLEKMQNLSVETSSRLTIKDSKLNNLLLGGNAQSRSNTTAEINVILENCEIAEKIKINSKAKLNIAGEKTKIAKIVVAVAAEVCKILCTTEVDTKKIENVITDENGEKPEEIKITQAYKITYHSNCDELENIEDFFSPDDGTISLPTDIFKRNEYIFAGWYKDKDCTESFNVSDKTADIHVYAKWIENIYIYDFTIEVTNLPESVKALSLWGTPNNWEFENIQKQADIYISKVTNGTAIFKFDKINTAEPLWCQFVPMTSRDMELNQSTWWQTAFSGSSEYATAENNLVYDFTTKKAVDKMTLVLDITSIYGDVSNVFNCRFITYNYKNAFTVISPSNEENFEDLGGTGVYSYSVDITNIATNFMGGSESPRFSVILLNETTLAACIATGDFKQAAAAEPEYIIEAFGNMRIRNTAVTGNHAVYGANVIDGEYQYYNGVAVTVTAEDVTLYVDMAKLVKTDLKALFKDTGNGDEAVMTEDNFVDLTGYKPYVIALGTEATDPDNKVFAAWSADVMKMAEGATFPAGDLKKDAPIVPSTASINCIVGSINGWAHTPMTDNTATFTAEGEDLFSFTNGGWDYRFADAVVNALDTEVELKEYSAGDPPPVTFADGVLTTGTKYTVTFIPTGEHTAYVKVSKAGNTTGNENEVTEYTVTASEVATTISKLSHGEHILKVTGEITSDTITEIATAMTNNTTPQINLDLSGTTGLTEIADSAFINCFRLTSITIPNSVTTIGNYAFFGCSNLTSINIPDNVTTIGDYAFSECSSLTSVTFNNTSGWYYINNSNFTGGEEIVVTDPAQNAENLKDTYSGYYWYRPTELTATADTVANTIRNLSAGAHMLKVSGEITSTTITTIATAMNSNTEAKINLDLSGANGLTEIPENAFYIDNTLNDNLISIIIPDSVTSIGDYAFYNCSSLTSIEIPNSVTSIGNYAFFGCSNLTSINIPDNVTTIGDYAFSECSSLTRITIPDGITSIGSSAFSNCSNLTDVTIPGNVTSIGYDAFYNCSSLTSVTFNNTSGWYYTNNSNFTGGEEIVVTDPAQNAENLKDTYSGYYWYRPTELTATADTVANTIRNLSAGAHMLKVSGEITSTTITTIATAMNSNTEAKINLDLSGANGLTEIPENAFYIDNTLNDNLISIIIPDSVTSIGDYAFYNCSSLTSIEIPNSVTSIGDGAFRYCSNLTNVTIPDSVTSIGSNAFYYCENLTSVIIGSSVTTIDAEAFYSCSGLTSIEIPDSVTTIGDQAFYECSSLTRITIPDNVTTIGDSAFFNCSSLTSVTIGNGVTSIGASAFSACSELTIFKVATDNQYYSSLENEKILYSKDQKTLIAYPSAEGDFTIPNSVTSIADGAFHCCSSLKSITIPDGVTSIGQYTFYYCENLTSVTIPNSVTTIGDYAFSYCENLTSIEIPDSVTTIGDHAFYNCSSLTSIKIPDNVTTIGDYAFYYCENLTSVIIGNGVTSIGYGAFYNCSSLTSVTFADTTSTWYYTESSDYTGGTVIDDVTDTAQNATKLKETYYDKYWYKSSTGGTAE